MLTVFLKLDAWLAEIIRNRDVIDKGSRIATSMMDFVASVSSNDQGKGEQEPKFQDIGVLRFPEFSRPTLLVSES
jgi:hypothetical protein